MKRSLDFRNSGKMVNLGLNILAVSYKTLHAEKLRNSYAPSNVIRTAWPAMLTEFSDLVEGMPLPMKVYYTPEEVRRANEICEIFSKLPYTSQEKKLTLTRARTHKTWRELATIYNMPWEQCRRTCDTVILHLVQAASMDKYKHEAKQVRQKINSTAQIYSPLNK